MTAKIWLLCHAPTSANRSSAFPDDEPIEDSAREKLQVLSNRLPHFDHLLAAPERSTRDTAAALGEAVQVEPALRDQDFGRWRGRTLTEVFAAEPDDVAIWSSNPHAAPHGGESVVGLIERVGAWLDTNPVEGRVLVVTHAAIIRPSIVWVLRAPSEMFWRIDVAPLSAAELSRDGRRWAFRCTLP
jgi:broad specificity phosphatase PhoE